MKYSLYFTFAFLITLSSVVSATTLPCSKDYPCPCTAVMPKDAEMRPLYDFIQRLTISPSNNSQECGLSQVDAYAAYCDENKEFVVQHFRFDLNITDQKLYTFEASVTPTQLWLASSGELQDSHLTKTSFDFLSFTKDKWGPDFTTFFQVELKDNNDVSHLFLKYKNVENSETKKFECRN